MVRLKWLCMALLLCACCSAVARADASEVVKVECPRRFQIQDVDVKDDATFLIAGKKGTLMVSSPHLIEATLSGEVLWSIAPKGKSDLYRDAIYLEDGERIALRNVVAARDDQWVVDFIRDGKVARTTKPMRSVFGIYPAANGIVVDSSPSWRTTRISKLDLNGNDA